MSTHLPTSRDTVTVEEEFRAQLARRNLSPDAAALLREKLYNSRKPAVTSQTGANQYSEVKAQNEQRPTTAESISAEAGVSRETVKRDAKFAQAGEKLGITKDVLAGTEKRTHKEIIQAAFPKSPSPIRERPLEDILSQRWEPFIKDIPFTKHKGCLPLDHPEAQPAPVVISGAGSCASFGLTRVHFSHSELQPAGVEAGEAAGGYHTGESLERTWDHRASGC